MMQHNTHSRAERSGGRAARLMIGCLCLTILGSLSTGADADAIKSRFSFNGNWIFKQFKQSPKQSVIRSFEERWIGTVPPWHREVMAEIRLPAPLESDPGLRGTDDVSPSGDGDVDQDNRGVHISIADRIRGVEIDQTTLRSSDDEMDLEVTDNAYGHSGQEFLSTTTEDQEDD